MNLTLQEVTQQLDALAHSIKDTINASIEREYYMWDDMKKERNVAHFGVLDVQLGRPRLKPDYSERILNFTDFTYSVELRSMDGLLKINLSQDLPGTWSPDPNMVHAHYTCFQESKFKDIKHVSTHNFSYLNWGDFMGDLPNIAEKIEEINLFYKELYESTREAIWERDRAERGEDEEECGRNEATV